MVGRCALRAVHQAVQSGSRVLPKLAVMSTQGLGICCSPLPVMAVPSALNAEGTSGASAYRVRPWQGSSRFCWRPSSSRLVVLWEDRVRA
jgi:hypothetical protein